VAAQMILQLRHFLCCERVQREYRTHRLGSKPPFAALAQTVQKPPFVNAHSSTKNERFWTGAEWLLCGTKQKHEIIMSCHVIVHTE
jgi:hypothetical protein